MRLFITAAATLLAAGSAHAVVVPNGDFEGGNTGFTSAYTFVPVGAEAQMGEAKYSVAFSANDTHTSFADYGDHTTGSGQYLVVNGAGAAGVTVWQSSPIALTSSGSYNFGAFLSTAFPTSPASLSFTVTPNVGPSFSIGTFSAPAATGVWSGVGGNFVVAPGVTSITLSIVNQNTDLNGNDFGIDDITLSIVPEPATWGLMIAGFGMVGFAARRRRAVVAA